MPDLGALPPIPRGKRAGAGAGAGNGVGTDPAFDILALHTQGLDELRRLARATWTDHNTHDPGITILELFCYALTELAYRADLPIDELVVRPGATTELTNEQTAAQFHRATKILPNRPWTTLDWRKSLIDLVDVKNAWIEPDESFTLVADLRRRELLNGPPLDPPPHPDWHRVTLRGLHRVQIEFMDSVRTAAQRAEVLRRVQQRLQTQRNLGEDFTEVGVVQPQFFALCAEIDLEAGADVTETAARLLFDVSQCIAPPVLNHPLDTMLARGHALPEVLEGPLLEHGAIDTAELAATALPGEIRLSDLIGVVMDVPGVRSVQDLLLNPLTVGLVDGALVDGAGEAVEVANPWRVPVAVGCLPRLSLANGRLVFSKRGLPVAGWQIAQMPPAVRTRLQALQDEARAKVEAAQSMEPPFAAGRSRDLAAYHSFQHDFPALYRIGALGLPTTTAATATTINAEKVRQAQALQLQAYLLFFDQWMADQLATLARASQRFSVAPADLQALATGWTLRPLQQHVLAAQPVTSIPAHIKLYADNTDAEVLAGLIESPAQAAARQQHTLDHLLARVGEDSFADYAAIIASAFGASDATVIADKCAFLEVVASIQHDRAGAYEQFPQTDSGVWNTTNVCGFERRLARLLGIADFTRRNLGTVSHDTYAEVDATPGDEFRFRVRHRISAQILLSSSTNYTTPEAARVEMMQAITRGQQPEGYRRAITSDGRHYFNIVDAGGAVIARRIQYFETTETMDQQIAELIVYLRTQYSGEGLYLVEHLLLRPTEPGDPMLPICNDAATDMATATATESATDAATDMAADIDPYSWRVHVLLPAYAGRFGQLAFREFVEQTIRQELPAHLLPTVCWIDADDMAVFERAWHEWLTLHAGFASSGRAAKLQALIDALVSAKNIYPQRRLFDCTDDQTKPPFILGKTSLGRSGGD